jgi:serine/threonine-protein kinase RsbW
MTVENACTVPARMECLSQALSFVEEFCRDSHVASSDSLRLSLVVEELFTNTVMHGHGGGSDAPVRIGLGAGPLQLELTYEDMAPPFDPLEHVARAAINLETGVSERPVGHLGITLVVNMAIRVSYARADGWNRLRLELRREAYSGHHQDKPDLVRSDLQRLECHARTFGE